MKNINIACRLLAVFSFLMFSVQTASAQLETKKQPPKFTTPAQTKTIQTDQQEFRSETSKTLELKNRPADIDSSQPPAEGTVAPISPIKQSEQEDVQSTAEPEATFSMSNPQSEGQMIPQQCDVEDVRFIIATANRPHAGTDSIMEFQFCLNDSFSADACKTFTISHRFEKGSTETINLGYETGYSNWEKFSCDYLRYVRIRNGTGKGAAWTISGIIIAPLIDGQYVFHDGVPVKTKDKYYPIYKNPCVGTTLVPGTNSNYAIFTPYDTGVCMKISTRNDEEAATDGIAMVLFPKTGYIAKDSIAGEFMDNDYEAQPNWVDYGSEIARICRWVDYNDLKKGVETEYDGYFPMGDPVQRKFRVFLATTKPRNEDLTWGPNWFEVVILEPGSAKYLMENKCDFSNRRAIPFNKSLTIGNPLPASGYYEIFKDRPCPIGFPNEE